jgi:hypothetical protein
MQAVSLLSRFTVLSTLALSATLALIGFSHAPARSTTAPVMLLGLMSGNRLVTFNAATPERVSLLNISGVTGKLIGIDQRPANGMIYGLSNQSQLYTINLSTGAATLVSRLNQSIASEAKVSIDFNPVPDRLRVVDENGNNFRVNVDTGEVTTDKPLNYVPEDLNNGRTPKVRAIAYTNAFMGPPSPAGVTPPTRTTQMFNLDTGLDILTQQNPPNEGRLKTIGALGINLDSTVGLDIFSSQMGENTAFVSSDSLLYRINLATGAANTVGRIGQQRLNIIDLASMKMPS